VGMHNLARGVFVSFFCLGFSVLLGCGGSQFTGSLAGRDGDGTGPKPSAGQAEIASLSPSTIAAGSASFALTVTGLNFTPTTTIMWDHDTSLTTTYVSSTVLRAQVPTSLIARPDTPTIIPSPVGTFNYGTNFTITAAPLNGNKSFTVSKVTVQANDMVWSPTDSRLYLAVASRDTSKPNTITSLDPQSGQFGSSLSTGSNPSKLAISSDGAYLYAGLNDSFAVHRYSLPALQSEINIPLGIGAYPGYYASDLVVQPTNSHGIAVVRSPSDVNYPNQGDVAIYDDSTPRTQTASSGTNLQINGLLWNTNGQNLYGTNSAAATVLYIMSVDNTGVQIKAKPGATSSLTGSLHFDSTTGYIYSDTGAILDSGSAAVVARFPVNALQSGFNPTPLMIPDSKLNIAYFLGLTIDGPGPGNYVIEAFDLTHFNLLGTASIPNVSGTPYKFIRWGSNGLAFLTTDSSGTGAAGGVYLVSGGFVTSPAP
jgi:IPT/TIG domain